MWPLWQKRWRLLFVLFVQVNDQRDYAASHNQTANRAYKLPGVDERIVVPLRPNAKKAYAALTVSAWVKLETNNHANYIQILEFYNPNYTGNNVRTLELKAMGPTCGVDQGTLRFGVRDSSNGSTGVNTPQCTAVEHSASCHRSFRWVTG